MVLRTGAQARLRARDRGPSSAVIGGKRRGRVQVGFTLGLSECKMDVKSRWMDSYSNEWIMCSWSFGLFSISAFLEVGLTHNRETLAL